VGGGWEFKIVLVRTANDNLLMVKLLIHKLLIGEVVIDKGMTYNLLVDYRRNHSIQTLFITLR
jgi:hypothetical protein